MLFVLGSILFLPSMRVWQTFGAWMFIAGSALMLVGALGELLKQVLKPHHRVRGPTT
ncbi:MAG: YrhK family protein [Novosphingobium sp.]